MLLSPPSSSLRAVSMRSPSIRPSSAGTSNPGAAAAWRGATGDARKPLRYRVRHEIDRASVHTPLEIGRRPEVDAALDQAGEKILVVADAGNAVSRDQRRAIDRRFEAAPTRLAHQGLGHPLALRVTEM